MSVGAFIVLTVSGLSVLTLILFGQVWFLGETYQQRGLEEKVVTSLTNMYLFLLLGAFIEIINVLLLGLYSDDIVSRNVLNSGNTITAFAGELVLGGSLLWLSREVHVRGQHRANVAKVPLFCWFAFLIYSPCQICTCALVAKFAMPAEELMVIISIIHAGIISFVCTKHIPSFSVCLGTLLRLLRLYHGLSVYYKEVDTFLWVAAVFEGILVTFILLVAFIATNVRYNMFKIAYDVLEENAEKDK